jgi:hypothetical protein
MTDSVRPELITERLMRALNRVARFDLLSDEQIDRIIDETLPDVPEDLRVQALEFVADKWEREFRAETMAALAAWEPSAEERSRPQ